MRDQIIREKTIKLEKIYEFEECEIIIKLILTQDYFMINKVAVLHYETKVGEHTAHGIHCSLNDLKKIRRISEWMLKSCRCPNCSDGFLIKDEGKFSCDSCNLTMIQGGNNNE